MDRVEIIQKIRDYVYIPDEQISVFFDYARERKLKKNEVLTRQGDSDVTIELIKSGCLMTYHTDDSDNDHVIQFGREMWWTGDLHAFKTGESSEYTVKAMAPTEVLLYSYDAFECVLQKAPKFETYFRKLFQNSLVSHQKRIIRNISCTAEEKYKAFNTTHPGLDLIVPQKYIASYLGITPEFLSKIRRRMAGK